MRTVRGVLTILLLCGFAVLGVFLGFLALLFFGLDAGSRTVFGAVLDGFGGLLAIAALALFVPAALALTLRAWRPMVSNAVATMLGLGVFALTAQDATTDGFLLAVSLSGLALVFCALPIPERRQPAVDR